MTVSASVEVKNKLGIHARPAMMLFELVQGFDAHVLLRNEEGVEADADSVIGLLMLLLVLLFRFIELRLIKRRISTL